MVSEANRVPLVERGREQRRHAGTRDDKEDRAQGGEQPVVDKARIDRIDPGESKKPTQQRHEAS